MEKIVSIKRFICGYEEYRFAELYEGGNLKTEKLPIKYTDKYGMFQYDEKKSHLIFKISFKTSSEL